VPHPASLREAVPPHMGEGGRLAPRPHRAISRPMARKHVNLGRAPAKADLPSKPCETCKRPFTWRRKWARDWDQVRYCSDRCRMSSGNGA